MFMDVCASACLSAQVKVFVTGLFSLNQDIPAFKEHLRDFLVQIKVSLFCIHQLYFSLIETAKISAISEVSKCLLLINAN